MPGPDNATPRTRACRAAVAALLLLALLPASLRAEEMTVQEETATPAELLRFTPLPDFGQEQFVPTHLLPEMCRKALAKMTCKRAADYALVQERDSVYKFSSFYGSAPQDFFCEATAGRLLLSSTAWGKLRVAVPYTVDAEKRCLEGRVTESMCGNESRFRCCE